MSEESEQDDGSEFEDSDGPGYRSKKGKRSAQSTQGVIEPEESVVIPIGTKVRLNTTVS